MFVRKARVSAESRFAVITSTRKMQHSNQRGMCKYKAKISSTCHGCGRQATVPFFLNSHLFFLSLSVVFTNVWFSILSQIVCNTNFANHLTCRTLFKCMHFFIELFNTRSFLDFLVLTLTFIIASEEKIMLCMYCIFILILLQIFTWFSSVLCLSSV